MKVVYAKRNSVVQMRAGYPVHVPLGTHWSADDPVVRENPELFSDDARFGLYGQPPMSDMTPPVEAATAGPGEQRTTRPRPGDMRGTGRG